LEQVAQALLAKQHQQQTVLIQYFQPLLQQAVAVEVLVK
jgi:hypothetical protein